MTVSVCMATYNGERFIEKQLETIYHQTLRPDEVIICDDGSKDKTVAIITKFISERHLEETWKLYLNTENKGYPGNFYYAMSLCSGDVVFLADQDDVWDLYKIENMVQIMENNPEIELLASRWGIIDPTGRILKEISHGKYKNTNLLRKINIKDILYYNDWPGMCMCYKNNFSSRMLERVKETKLHHDMALALAAAENEVFFCVDRRHQFHRRHDANVAEEEHRVHKLLNKKRKLHEIEKYLKMLEEILDSKVLMCKSNNLLICRKKSIMQERLENLKTGRPIRMIKQYINNRQDVRLATLICDLVITIRRSF